MTKVSNIDNQCSIDKVDNFTNPVEAYQYYIQAEGEAVHRKDEEATSLIRIALTKILLKNGAYKEALDKNLRALNYFSEKGDLDNEVKCWKYMVLLYGYLGNRKKQLTYNEKCLQIAKSLNQKEESIKILNNMGHAYFELGLHDKAAMLFKQNLKEPNLTPDLKAVSLKNLGKVYLAKKEYSKAKKLHAQTVAFVKNHNLPKYLIACDYLLGAIYFGEGKPQKSLVYFKRSVDTLYEKGILRKELLVMLEAYLNALTEMGDKESLKLYFRKFVKLTNELNKEYRNQKTKHLQFQFEINQVEKQCAILIKKNEELEAANKQIALQKLALETKSTQLERVNRELIEFAHRIAHDLKQPMRTVSSFTHLLEMELCTQLSNDSRKYMEFITNSIKDMNKFIDDILKYAKSDQSNQEIENVDMVGVIQTIERRLALHLEEKKVKLIYESLPDIEAHSALILQVFQNLISNAIKFSQVGVDAIIKIRGIETTEKYVFEIEDNGIGIAEKNQQKIFQLFTRLNRKEDYEGTGIGLSTVLKILRRYNATIDLKSVVGKGTTFRISFPKIKPKSCH